VASAALATLLDQGLFSLYLCEEPLGGGDIDELPPGTWPSTLAAGPHWNVPTPGVTSVRFLASESGSAAHSLSTDLASNDVEEQLARTDDEVQPAPA
jgi:hypothetical protein